MLYFKGMDKSEVGNEPASDETELSRIERESCLSKASHQDKEKRTGAESRLLLDTLTDEAHLKVCFASL